MAHATATPICTTLRATTARRTGQTTSASVSTASSARRGASTVAARAFSSSIVDRADDDEAAAQHAPTRRATIASMMALSAAMVLTPADASYAAYGAAPTSAADEDEEITWSVFYGAAAPPATYGSLGGTTKSLAKYSYDVASNWKEEPTTKVEKGSGGQDSRWVKRGSRGEEKAYLLTLNPAGQDGASFELTEAALQAVAGALSEMQDAISSGRVTSSKSTEDGRTYATYNIDSDRKYTVKIAIDNTGRIFAFVVTAPASQFNKDKKVLDRMVGSFKIYSSVSQFV